MIKHRPWLIALSAFLLILVWMIGVWVKFLYTPLVTAQQGVTYVVRNGATMSIVVKDLHHLNVIKNPLLFKLLVRIKGVGHQLKAGEYFFSKGTTPSKLLRQMVTGSGMVYYSFTIVPGWNFRELKEALLRNPHVRHTIPILNDKEIMQKLDCTERLKLEGEFYPDTYFFVENTEDVSILKRACKAMQNKLVSVWENRAPGLPFKNAYEALIAASIIEKEAYLANDLPIIAGVLVNRLNKGMLLQLDPTVIYGMGLQFSGKIRKSDLAAKNPYNTYQSKGLPPTPISMPSLAALQAAMHPAQHQYYYFVAQADGSNLYSTKLDDHHKAVLIAKNSKWFFNQALVQYYLLDFVIARSATTEQSKQLDFVIARSVATKQSKQKESYARSVFSDNRR